MIEVVGGERQWLARKASIHATHLYRWTVGRCKNFFTPRRHPGRNHSLRDRNIVINGISPRYARGRMNDGGRTLA
jgi:hypothetical protein